jgi:hypothetical protein
LEWGHVISLRDKDGVEQLRHLLAGMQPLVHINEIG